MKHKGNVKEMKVYSALYPFGEVKKSYLKELHKYDKNGNHTEISYYNSDGSSNGRTIYKFDFKTMTLDIRGYDANEEINSRELRKYDDNWNLIENTKYKSDGTLEYKSIKKYDKYKNLIKESIYSPDGSCIDMKYVYDDKNRLILEKEDSEDCKSEISYKYDDKGNYTKEENIYDGEVWFVEKYDRLGNLLEEISDYGLRYDGVYGVDINQISRTIYKYDRGRKVSEESYIEEVEYDEGWSSYYKTGDWLPNGKKEYKYKYDDLGNLTEEITFEGEASLFVEGVIYEYEYYDQTSNIENEMYWKKCDIKKIKIADKNFVRISNPSKMKKDRYWVYLSKSTYDKLEKGDDFDEVLEQYDFETKKFLAIGQIPKKNGEIIRKVFVTRAVARSVAYYAWLYIQYFDCDASDDMKGKDASHLEDDFLEKSNKFLNLYISLRKNLDSFLSGISVEVMKKYLKVEDIVGAKQKFNRIIYHTYLDCQFMRSDYDKEEVFHKNTGVFYEKKFLEGTDVYCLDENYLMELGMRECSACSRKVETKWFQL